LDQTDKAKLIPHLEYLEREYQFFDAYRSEVDWQVYQTQRAKRLEIERWVECLINATLDISKIFFVVRGEEVPETSREILFKIGAEICRTEKEAEEFSELAKIRNTLAHRYLDIKWNDIKRFFQIGAHLYPLFIKRIRKQIQI